MVFSFDGVMLLTWGKTLWCHLVLPIKKHSGGRRERAAPPCGRRAVQASQLGTGWPHSRLAVQAL